MSLACALLNGSHGLRMERGMEVCVITRNKQDIVNIIALSALTFAAVGCTHALPEARHGQAAGEWTARLPTAPGPYAGLAFGKGGSSEPAEVKQDVAAQPMLAKLERPAQHKQAARVIRHDAVAATEPVIEQPSAPQEATALNAERVTTPDTNVVASAEPAATSAEERYSDREAQSQKLQQYRGGDAIIISASALVIVLLIVVLILLLR
jgi:hypothetical protein